MKYSYGIFRNITGREIYETAFLSISFAISKANLYVMYVVEKKQYYYFNKYLNGSQFHGICSAKEPPNKMVAMFWTRALFINLWHSKW